MKSLSPSTATGNGGRAVVVVCGVDSSEASAKDGTAPIVPTSLKTSVGDLEPSPSGVENEAAGGEGVCEY